MYYVLQTILLDLLRLIKFDLMLKMFLHLDILYYFTALPETFKWAHNPLNCPWLLSVKKILTNSIIKSSKRVKKLVRSELHNGVV